MAQLEYQTDKLEGTAQFGKLGERLQLGCADDGWAVLSIRVGPCLERAGRADDNSVTPLSWLKDLSMICNPQNSSFGGWRIWHFATRINPHRLP